MALPPFLQPGSKKKPETATTSLRLPVELIEWLDETAKRLNVTRTDLVVDCIRYVMDLAADEDDAAKKRAHPAPKQK